jgi:hypothetical protein
LNSLNHHLFRSVRLFVPALPRIAHTARYFR